MNVSLASYGLDSPLPACSPIEMGMSTESPPDFIGILVTTGEVRSETLSGGALGLIRDMVLAFGLPDRRSHSSRCVVP